MDCTIATRTKFSSHESQYFWGSHLYVKDHRLLVGESSKAPTNRVLLMVCPRLPLSMGGSLDPVRTGWSEGSGIGESRSEEVSPISKVVFEKNDE